MKATERDFLLVDEKINFTSPEDLPIRFQYGPTRRMINGLPSEFSPKFSSEDKG